MGTGATGAGGAGGAENRSPRALLEAVDAHVPVPGRYTDAPFLLGVENVLTIGGRGVRVGDRVEVLGAGITTVVTGVETFGRPMEGAEAADSIALLLSAVRGGRRTPVSAGYRPQFYIRTADVVGDVDLGAAAVARPGDTVGMTVRLGRPVPLEPGLGFTVREGGRTVGAGTVTSVG